MCSRIFFTMTVAENDPAEVVELQLQLGEFRRQLEENHLALRNEIGNEFGSIRDLIFEIFDQQRTPSNPNPPSAGVSSSQTSPSDTLFPNRHTHNAEIFIEDEKELDDVPSMIEVVVSENKLVEVDSEPVLEVKGPFSLFSIHYTKVPYELPYGHLELRYVPKIFTVNLCFDRKENFVDFGWNGSWEVLQHWIAIDINIGTDSNMGCDVIVSTEILEMFVQYRCICPETVALVSWETDIIKTYGESLAQALWMIDVRSEIDVLGRVNKLQVVSLEELGRLVIDVVANYSIVFEDLFINQWNLSDRAVKMVAKMTNKEFDIRCDMNVIFMADIDGIGESETSSSNELVTRKRQAAAPIKTFFLCSSIDLKRMQAENRRNVIPASSHLSNYLALRYYGYRSAFSDIEVESNSSCYTLELSTSKGDGCRAFFLADDSNCSSNKDLSGSISSMWTLMTKKNDDDEKNHEWGVLESDHSHHIYLKGSPCDDGMGLTDVTSMNERILQLPQSEDTTSGHVGVSTTLALSNAIANLSAFIFKEMWKLVPFSEEKMQRWMK